MYYSTVQYASLAWYRFKHAKQIDVALAELCRLITGYLKLSSREKVPILAPLSKRRETGARAEHTKAELTIYTCSIITTPQEDETQLPGYISTLCTKPSKWPPGMLESIII